MYRIVGWCLDNRAVVILFTLILMVGGGVSAFRLNQELLPSIDFPQVFVLVPDPGAGPEQVDRDISRPLASGLTGLPRAKHVTTQSSQGFSQVSISFDLDSQIKDDLDAVNQRLATVQLPAGAGRPVVQTFSFSALPVMTYALLARDGDLARATAEAQGTIVPALNGATGVAQVKVSGGAKPQVRVTLDGTKMAAAGVSLQQVGQTLSAANVDLPAGTTVRADQTLPVEVKGSIVTVADLQKLVLVPAGGGTTAGAGAAPAAATAGPPG
ncbi:MAG: efflux RND transporter permease subunit, partial [Candidatus Dormibacteraeota bacterium]|nr:efflux RND transporter permease subunit [Candidatus Dormibacteraeota bacterium]